MTASETAHRHRLTVEWVDPAGSLAEAASLEPIEYLRRLAIGELPRSPIGELMGFDAMDVEPGVVRFEVTAGPQHLNPIGLVHGGLAATLLDSALGCAIHSTLPRGAGYSTVQLNVHYVRAIAPGERLRAEGRVVHGGRTIATAEGEVRDGRDRIVAHATTTCAVALPPDGDA
jgi:uncharacterized protein (TIGR00369 family)